MDWNEEFLSVEVEREIARSHHNQSDVIKKSDTKGCGCTSLLISLIISIIVWRLILEIISVLSK